MGSAAHLWPSRDGLRRLLERRAALWLTLFLLPIVVARTLQLRERIGPPIDPVVFFDARAYLEAAGRAFEGLSLYLPLQIAGPYPASGLSLYLYPPLFAQLLAPFSTIDPLLFGAGVVTASFAAAALVLWRVAHSSQAGRTAAVGAIAALLLIPGGFTTLVTANIEYAIVAALGAALLLERSRPVMAGALMGIAVLWKPLLFPLALYALARRDRALIRGGGVVIGGGLLLSLILGGSAPWVDYLRATANLSSEGLMGVTFSLGDAARTAFGPAGLPLLVLALALLLIWLARHRPAAALLVAVAGGIAAAPLIWGRYLLLFLPFAVGIAHARARIAVAAAIAIGTIEPRIDGSDHVLLRTAVTAGVAGALLIAARAADRPPQRG